MFERIVVPLDGSIAAESVLPQIGRLLQRTGAEVVLVRAVPVPPQSGGAAVALHAAMYAEAERHVRGVAARLRRDGLRATGVTATGDPAEVIAETARGGASLVAMSTHGRTGLSRLAYGSVTGEVLMTRDVAPVLAVRAFRNSAGVPMPAEPQEMPFANILVPFDGSGHSLSVLPWVEELARLFCSRVVFLSVAEDAPFAAGEARELDDASERLSAGGVPVIRLRRRGAPAEAILDAANQFSIDLIAMATHGRSGLRRLVLGSVTESVIQEARVPVLIARCGQPAPAESEAG